MIYEPSDDSYLLAEQVRKYSFGKECLDIGSGSGIQALTALSAGAKSVIATDIQNDSISLLDKKGIKTLKSDLFSNIKGKFDLIIFNPPYLPQDAREDSESAIITSGGNRGDELTLKFIRQSNSHLKKDGKMLLVFSSITPQDLLIKELKKSNFKKTILSSKKLFMEQIEVWLIERIKRFKSVNLQKTS